MGLNGIIDQGLAVTANGGAQVDSVGNGHVCTDNSTSTPLAGGASFTGAWQDTLNYNCLTFGVNADQDSATDGFDIQWSPDGVIIADHDYFTIGANAGKNFTFSPARRYVRVVYTNGATPQTVFNLQTIFKKGGFKPSSHRIQDSIVNEDDAELVKAVLTGENPAGTFVNFQSTTQGNFKISLEELENDVSVNGNTQLKATLFDSEGVEIKTDSITGSLATIDYAHHEIHSGSHFYVKDWTDIAGSTFIDFLVRAPNTTTWAHMALSFAFEAEANIAVYRSPTTTSDGSQVPTFNRNENSSNTATLLIYSGPTVTATGTKIAGYKAGSGKSAGGGARSESEIVLKQNTDYLVRITNDTVTNNWCDYLADWYEHENL